MEKIVIEIDDKTFGRIFHRDCIGQEYDYEVTRAIVNGIKLPDNATNGDVIKALFPDIKVYGCSGYAHSSDKSSVLLEHMSSDWWNASYKAGDADG